MSDIIEFNEHDKRDQETNTAPTEEAVESPGTHTNDSGESSNGAAGLDENDPLSDENIKKAKSLLKTVRDTMEVIRNIWVGTKRQYNLTGEHMAALWKFNVEHRSQPDPTQVHYDEFNGINKSIIPEIGRIFGKDHPFSAISLADGTVEILKSALADYINYVRFSKEYEETDRAYLLLLEMREEQDMVNLQKEVDSVDDPEKKQDVINALNRYYSVKFLDYLRDPLPDTDKQRIVKSFGDEKQISYYISRCKDKLVQLGLNSSIILLVSNFEKNLLPERYHKLNNTLLLYFMTMLIYTDTANNISPKNKPEVDKIVAMIQAIDAVVRKCSTEENMTRIKNNVMGLLDQVIEPIYEKYYPDQVIPEVVSTEQTSDKKEE